MYTPQRMCIACRVKKPPEELLRISYNKASDYPVPDTDTKNAGRGAYICRDAKCIERAKKKHVIERHLKCDAHDALYTALEAML